MRGLAAALMLQGHVFDAWLRPPDRTSEWFWLSQFLGGLPAPIFLFLVGVSLALVLDRMRVKGASPLELARKIARRGGWILLLAYAFRLEQFLVWYPASRWSDVFRVDTLNCIAACTLAIGFFSILFKTRRANIAAMGLCTAIAVLVTPWVYPLRGNIPEFLVAYLNSNGHPWYFSIFPWIAFALAGMTFGYILLETVGPVSDRPIAGGQRPPLQEERFFNSVAVAGVGAFAIGVTMSLFPSLQYGFFDYSLTSPHYFFVRLGWLLLILYGAYKWSTREGGDRFSPLRVMGQASLLVYWVHIEIVYGRPFNDYLQALDLSDTVRQLLWVVPLMFALAAVRHVQRTWRRDAVKTAVDRLDIVKPGQPVVAGIAGLRQES